MGKYPELTANSAVIGGMCRKREMGYESPLLGTLWGKAVRVLGWGQSYMASPCRGRRKQGCRRGEQSGTEKPQGRCAARVAASIGSPALWAMEHCGPHQPSPQGEWTHLCVKRFPLQRSLKSPPVSITAKTQTPVQSM